MFVFAHLFPDIYIERESSYLHIYFLIYIYIYIYIYILREREREICRLAQLFLDTSAVILRKKSEKTKIETSYIVVFLNGTNCLFVD